jgi:hypothetical protein
MSFDRVHPLLVGLRGRRLLRSWLAVLGMVLAVGPGCGGGGLGSGGTGAPLAQGTVTGFGSVIVDGVAVDDAQAEVQVDDVLGVFRRAEARLGHQVEIEFDDQRVARTIRVGAQALGQVESVSAPGRFVVLGREVVVNADPAFGPVTVLDGFASAADVAVGQWVEVHGIEAPADTLQATRLQRLATAPLVVRLSGRIEALPAANTFRLAGGPTVAAAAALRLPLGTDLAVGQRVTVLAPASEVRRVLGNTVVAAGLVRVRGEPAVGRSLSLAGRVDRLGPTGFELAGWQVDIAGATLDPPGALTEGRYVRVEGTVASAGRLTAREVKVRSALSDGQDIELKGNLTGLTPDRLAFSLRGVGVVVPVGLVPVGCLAGVIGNGVYVQVQARIQSGVVVARSIECRSESGGAVVTRQGVVTSVDEARQRLVLQTVAPGGAQSVEWTALTFFRDPLAANAASLNGRTVEVDGVLRGADAVLVARRVRPAD